MYNVNVNKTQTDEQQTEIDQNSQKQARQATNTADKQNKCDNQKLDRLQSKSVNFHLSTSYNRKELLALSDTDFTFFDDF